MKPEPVAPPPTRNPARAAVPHQAEPVHPPKPRNNAVARADGPPPVDANAALAAIIEELSSARSSPGEGLQLPVDVMIGANVPVDPDKDLAPTGPRLPRYIVAAVALIRQATKRTQQEIIADALSGRAPIPAAVLDATHHALYGYPMRRHG